MRDRLIRLLNVLLCTRCSEDECANIADLLIANGVTFATDNNVGDKEMIRHLFNRCAAMTQCSLCFCCGYQKKCENARNIFAKDGK